jgi:hypothetical protein
VALATKLYGVPGSYKRSISTVTVARSNSAICHFNRLSLDELRCILRYLSVPEVVEASLVCKKWREACYHKTIWANYSFESFQVYYSQSKSFYEFLKRLRKANAIEKKQVQDQLDTWAWKSPLHQISKTMAISIIEDIPLENTQ